MNINGYGWQLMTMKNTTQIRMRDMSGSVHVKKIMEMKSF